MAITEPPATSERPVDSIPLGRLPGDLEPGTLPRKMTAWVIRREREGEPLTAFQQEEIEVPEPGADEVVVMVMAAGVNFNNVWAALGQPVSVFDSHPEFDHHIGGSDASGIVWKVGANVRRWKPGDEVVIHCNQSCGECPECNGLDPLACEFQRIWGYETTWGSFAQFTRVQSQQLVPKPKHLTWEEAASYALTYFTAYRMLIDQCDLKAGDNVLVWGAAGGLGVFGIQLCRLIGANAVGVVSSEDKKQMVLDLGAVAAVNRRDYGFERTGRETPEEEKARLKEAYRFRRDLRAIFDGKEPNVVFEHVGQATFPTSVLVCSRFGKIVIVGATSGFQLDFDVRHLWMRQKQVIGSHFANAYEATRANQLMIEKKIQPVLSETLPWEDVAKAHQKMRENAHTGKIAILVQAGAAGEGRKE
ncbi:MAG TPA: crotonyl-CoA carboxylase/reductase [Candidatus Dormibacteraeota bacterium]|jgi:crotonyl-CoA carboxylase/reductase|nr:crotonyl-CoA carboxylase/reductase [Candidatus Dormibacteraeota bacterium]